MMVLRVLWQYNLAGHQSVMKAWVPSGIFICDGWVLCLLFFNAWFSDNCSNLHIIILDLLFKCHIAPGDFSFKKPAAAIKLKRTWKCEILTAKWTSNLSCLFIFYPLCNSKHQVHNYVPLTALKSCCSQTNFSRRDWSRRVNTLTLFS